jgi:hypothetical protein
VVLGQLAHHGKLRRIIGRAERDVMHRAAALATREEIAGHADVDNAADLGARRLEADR